MAGKGIYPTSCPKARIRPRLRSEPEKGFGDLLMRAMKKKVNVFVKVRVLDVIELVNEPDRQRMKFWLDQLGRQHFDYVICRPNTLEPLLAAELEAPTLRRRSSTADDVKSTAARKANFPLVRFSAGSNLTPELVRQKLIAEYRVARAGRLPEEMGDS
jgi:hypothetical protein